MHLPINIFMIEQNRGTIFTNHCIYLWFTYNAHLRIYLKQEFIEWYSTNCHHRTWSYRICFNTDELILTWQRVLIKRILRFVWNDELSIKMLWESWSCKIDILNFVFKNRKLFHITQSLESFCIVERADFTKALIHLCQKNKLT